MTTTTSFSSRERFLGLYRTVLRRNVGYLGLFSVLVVLFYPLQYALEAFKRIPTEELVRIDPAALAGNPYYSYELYGLGRNFTAVSGVFFTALVLIAPVVLALLLNSYMHSKKAADVYHALPVSRGMLLSVNAAAGMTIIALPVAASTLVIAVMQAARFGAAALGWLLLDLCGWLAAALCIYAITTFVSVCAGTVFDSLVFSCVLFFAAPALSGLYLLLADVFLYGWDVRDSAVNLIFRLSPVTLMPARLLLFDGQSSDAVTQGGAELIASNWSIPAYLLLGLLVLWASVRIYRRRRTEMAETTTSRGILQVLVKLVGTLVCGALFGLLFYSLGYPESNGQYLLWSAVGGFLTYAIVEVVLNRGFKTLLRSLPLGAGMVALLLGCSALLMTGGLGYETRIPAAADVASVQFSLDGRYAESIVWKPVPQPDGTVSSDTRYDGVLLSEPENIELIRAFHERVTAEEGETTWGRREIVYHLKNGRTFKRTYNWMSADTLRLLTPLETSAELLAQRNPAFFTRGEWVTRWSISDPYGRHVREQAWSAADSQAMLDAIQADLLAQTAEDLRHPSGHPLALLQFTNDPPREGCDRFAEQGSFVVTDESQQTWQLLKKRGLLDQVRTDLGECIAVTARMGDRNYSVYNRSNGPVLQMTADDAGSFNFRELREARENLASMKDYYLGNPGQYAVDYGTETVEYTTDSDGQSTARAQMSNERVVFEDPAEIRAFAEHAAASLAADEPYVMVNFYFEDAATGYSQIVPYASLPRPIRQKLLNPYQP